MTDPQHLWSGDWSQESAAARERAARDRALAEPSDAPSPPAEQASDDAPSRGVLATIAAGWRAGLRSARSAFARSGLSPARVVTIAVIAAVAGGAITVGAEGLAGNGGHGRAWLGVALEANPAGSGALIEYVVPGGPADRAGIEPGDVIGAVNGHPVGAPVGLVDDIAGMRAGDQVALAVSRLGQQRVIDATLAARPSGGP